uniref:Putative ovule protein n=1 Tax=Solanum chacoense TaxID=4108 RepID=A0A0V0GIB4_SOLCH
MLWHNYKYVKTLKDSENTMYPASIHLKRFSIVTSDLRSTIKQSFILDMGWLMLTRTKYFRLNMVAQATYDVFRN